MRNSEEFPASKAQALLNRLDNGESETFGNTIVTREHMDKVYVDGILCTESEALHKLSVIFGEDAINAELTED